MTREVAIDNLKADIKYWENTSVSTEHLYMAIKALEQEPCGDCVSRQAVNDLYDRYHPRLATHVYEFGEELKALSSVLPKRKQGEWCEQNDDYFDWYECSECGYGSEGEMQYSSEHDVRTKYCPNCGAEMR